jgi:hypothetical protein
MYLIEDNVPYEKSGGRFGKYDFSFIDQIQIGQSVVMQGKEVQALRSHINRRRERNQLPHGFAIATRRDKEIDKVRVWRLS